MNLLKFSVNNSFMENFIFELKNSFKKIIKSKKLKTIINLVLILISFGILFYFCLQNNNLLNLSHTILHMNLLYLQVAFLCIILSWIFDSIILKNLTYETCQKKYKQILFFKITMIGQYFTVITPLGVAAQPMQISEFKKYGINQNVSASLLLRKFFVYQTCLLIYSITSFILYFYKIKTENTVCLCLSVITGLLFQGAMIFLIALFSINKNLVLCISKFTVKVLHKLKVVKNESQTTDKFITTLNKFISNNKNLRKNKKLNFKLYIFTFLQITLSFLITFFIFKAFNHTDYPILPITCTQNITNTISSFTPLPGAAGTTENIFLILFKPFFYENEITQAMIIFRFINFYFALIIGFIFYKIKIKNFQN